MGRPDASDRLVGADETIKLNHSDVLVTATGCGDIDVGSVEVHVRFSDGTRGDFDIGVAEYCRGEGNPLTAGMLNTGDIVALHALASEVGMRPDDVLTRLVDASAVEVNRCIKESMVETEPSAEAVRPSSPRL